eukprot:TRINITY_DN419_c0_g2_i3.p1 TRINITY_DN419_c0_g2~~TRINITY_DN419_c0_g2_i3.p1  ORF type:complete len:174 (+),score=29.87 TRINITY_DN419_c0_g2_i3:46-567(+)
MGNRSTQPLVATEVLKEAQKRVSKDVLSKLQDDWGNRKEIGYEEFCKLMQQLPSDDLNALFTLYDINHNGRISWKEYVCTVVLIMNGTLEEKLDLLFNAFDEDRNGRISKKEFASAVGKFSKEESTDFIERTFQECDKNKDETISKEEFFQFLQIDQERFKKACGILAVGLVS